MKSKKYNLLGEHDKSLHFQQIHTNYKRKKYIKLVQQKNLLASAKKYK